MESNNDYKYGYKSVFAQSLALVGICFVQIGLGVEMICSTIIIGALSVENKSEDEWLSLTSDQASWFGSLLFLFTPVGSVLSSLTLGLLGHNRCMIITNIPYIVSQVMFLYADNVTTLYASSILMGLSVGYSGGPCSAYIGEVCEPKLRGTLMSAANVFFYVGSLIFTLVNATTNRWRQTVLINLSIPIINIIILLMTPHSPMWLLTKGKKEKAQKTLGKLRGWVSHEKCSSEFREMIIYTSVHNHETSRDKNDTDSTSSWGQLLKPEVYRPFRLLMIYLFFANLLSGIQYGPFLVSVFTEFGAPVNVQLTIAFSSFLSIIGGILTVVFVNSLGKRFLTLFTLSICSICYILIGLIGIYWTSSKPITSWLVLILYLTTTFMSSFGIMPIGWILLTEIFPMKSRNITCSVCTALGYLMSFFMIKYYPEFSTMVTFYNTFTIFGAAGLVGSVYFYYYLPETENRTLQEISEFFK